MVSQTKQVRHSRKMCIHRRTNLARLVDHQARNGAWVRKIHRRLDQHLDHWL